MTIIAWDGKKLVADSRVTDSESTLVGDNYQKLHCITIKDLGKCVVGFAGACYAQGPWTKHLETEGLVPFEELEPELVMYALVIDRKGNCYEAKSTGGWFKVPGPTTIGSGNIIAQHYLVKGCDAYTAVVETCKTELSCGGEITVYDSSTGKFETFTP